MSASPASAQTYAAATDLLFYGDNSEFANPFRRGETVLGVSGRIFLEITLNETVKIRGGLFGSGRFGSHEFVEQVIRRYEPRFKSVRVELRENKDEFDRTLRFRIDAVLYAEPTPEPVTFDSKLEPTSANFEIRTSQQ